MYPVAEHTVLRVNVNMCGFCRYLPILPVVLVNGAEGIGTGWSTSIPNYNPMDVVRNIRKMLDGEPIDDMLPWYRNFNGDIYEIPAPRNATGKSFQVNGLVQQVCCYCDFF